MEEDKYSFFTKQFDSWQDFEKEFETWCTSYYQPVTAVSHIPQIGDALVSPMGDAIISYGRCGLLRGRCTVFKKISHLLWEMSASHGDEGASPVGDDCVSHGRHECIPDLRDM
jgi:hypothetical protein